MRPGSLWGFHRVLDGLWWSLVAVEVVLLSVLSMNSESFLLYIVMIWLTEKFVDSSGSWCLLVYLHFRMCLLHSCLRPLIVSPLFSAYSLWNSLAFLCITYPSCTSPTPPAHLVPTLYITSCTQSDNIVSRQDFCAVTWSQFQSMHMGRATYVIWEYTWSESASCWIHQCRCLQRDPSQATGGVGGGGTPSHLHPSKLFRENFRHIWGKVRIKLEQSTFFYYFYTWVDWRFGIRMSRSGP